MTYTDAAVEVLRRIGQPTHFKEIAAQAVAEDLLSHVGVTPEATMGARLLAMSHRDGERRVVATAPGIFALAEWGLEADKEPSLDEPLMPGDNEPAFRPKERHPALQDEIVLGNRRDDRRRRSDSGDDSRRRKRYGPPAELAHAWLLERGEPATLADIAAALRENDKIAEALERDLSSLDKALQEENRRRADQRRPLLFDFLDDGRVAGLEAAKAERPAKKEPKAKAKREKVREEPAKTFVAADEQRKLVLRALRRRLGGLDVAALERVVVALLETQGYREMNMARRSAKEGPLYLTRRRWGAGELRYAVRVLRSGRDLGRTEVQEVRRDASHFSAQMGAIFGNAECTRDARSEANTPGGVPVMLYGNEALAEALIDAGLGVTRQLIEWVDYDESFFDSIGAEAPLEEFAELAPSGEGASSVESVEFVESSESAETSDAVETRDDQREETRGRRRRGRGRRGDRESNGQTDGSSSTKPEEPSTGVTASADETTSDAAEPEAPTAEAADIQVEATESVSETKEETVSVVEQTVESSVEPDAEPKIVSEETSGPEQA